MKKLLFAGLVLLATSVQAQHKEKTPAAKGVTYGIISEEKNPVKPGDIKGKMTDDHFNGQVKGKVVEVCKTEGCWIRLERAEGGSLMVRAKDHSFLMPENIVGKTVLIEGVATIQEFSEDMRKHIAEDAGKSKAEIAKITGPDVDFQFIATGVKVLD